MSCISDADYFQCQLMDRHGGEGQKDLDASCSLFRLRMIRCKDCSQLWRELREEGSGREKSVVRVYAPSLLHPAPVLGAPQQLITGDFPRALLYYPPYCLCVHCPASGGDICHHVTRHGADHSKNTSVKTQSCNHEVFWWTNHRLAFIE